MSSLKGEVYILISLALVLLCSSAERDYFTLDWRNLTWDEARGHCQVCFTELATLTPENIQAISRTLTSDCWVGLRKNLSTPTSSRFWSHWANGEPLTFQNWYPGWPVFKSSKPKYYCCSSCSAGTTTTGYTSDVTGGYTGDVTGGYTGDVTGGHTGDVTGGHTGDVTGGHTGDVTGGHTGDVTGGYTGDVTGGHTGDVTGGHTGDVTGGHTGDVTGGYTGDVTGGHTGDVTGGHTGDVTGGHTGDVTGGYTGDVTGGHTGDVTGGHTGDVTGGHTGDVTGGHTGDVTGGYTGDVTGGYTGDDTGGCMPAAVVLPDAPGSDGNYVEDSCVAMLSFGAWVEKSCSERLSFICYEDRIQGQVNVTNVTSESAVLTWLPTSGPISHYRVEVETLNKTKRSIPIQPANSTYDLDGLVAGTHYSVKVFPVKCMRDLHPQENAFYTRPNKVENLQVINVTETSVFLSWTKPAGNVTLYLVAVRDRELVHSSAEAEEVNGLTPGNLYTFTVFSAVNGSSTRSDGETVQRHTKPGKVSELRVFNNTVDSLVISWVRPQGSASGFRVRAMMDGNDTLFNKTVNQTQVAVTGLPKGTEIRLSVTALLGAVSLEGDSVTVLSYTVPGSIPYLNLTPAIDSIRASWESPDGNVSTFTVELYDGENIETIRNVTAASTLFEGLKTVSNYSVVVTISSGQFNGPSVRESTFTKPARPSNVVVTSFDKNHIALKWDAPKHIAKAEYTVGISSRFWNHHWSVTVEDRTDHRFDGLRPGTRYNFEVRTVGNMEVSEAAPASHKTDAERREVSLSMLCSSAEPLFCDERATRKSVLEQLNTHFQELLGDDVFWHLNEQEAEYKGTQ